MPRIASIPTFFQYRAKRRRVPTRIGLITHYDLADTRSYPGSGSTVYDLSDIGNHGTLAGTPYVSTSQGWYQNINTAISLSMGTLYTFQNFTNGITEVFWYKPPANNYSNMSIGILGRAALYAINPVGAGLVALGVPPDHMTLQAFANWWKVSGTIKTRFTLRAHAFIPASTAAWIHVAIVRSRANLEIYINGVLASSGNPKYLVYDNGVTQLYTGASFDLDLVKPTAVPWGKYDTNSIFGAAYYAGKYGTYRAYTVALSGSSVQDIYNSEKSRYFGSTDATTILPTLITDGLVFSTKSTLLSDTVGSTTGQTIGTVTYVNSNGGYTNFPNPPGSTWPKNWSDAINYASTAALSGFTEITVSVWFKSEYVATTIDYRVGFGLVDKLRLHGKVYQSGGSYATYPSYGFQLYWQGTRSVTAASGNFYIRFGTGSYAGGTNVYKSESSSLIQQNIWYNVTFTVTGAGATNMYIQGEEESIQKTGGSGINLNNTLPMWIGRGKNSSWGYANQSSGPGGIVNIGRVHIYNRALTAEEVWQNYSAEKAIYT